MTWQDHADRAAGRNLENPPVVHDGRVICLWHAEGRSTTFDPAANTWTDLASPFGSGIRAGAVIVSAGPQLVVWGGAWGSSYGGRDFKLRDDGAVLAANGTWKRMAEQRAPSQRGGALQAWTGTEVLVWGGWKMGKPVKGGAAYDPARDAWRKMAARESLADRADSVWNGKELWFWDRHESERTGHAYDPKEDRWRALATFPENRANERAMVRCLEGALWVGREGHFGSDIDGCAVWRYEPQADLWEPSAPPPVVRGGTPRLVDCDGRIVLGLGERTFEYLPSKDAWAELPPHGLGHGPYLVWVAQRLFAFGKSGTRSLELPASTSVKALAPPKAPVVVAAPPVVSVATGSPVTALAIAAGEAIVGYADGRVARNGSELRRADGRCVAGVAAHDGGWTCLVGERLETRRAGERPKLVELGFAGEKLAHRGGVLVVAGDGALAAFERKREWTLTRQVAIKGATIHLALLGDTIARVVSGPEKKKKGERKEPRDTIELRDASTLKLRDTIIPPFASTTVAAAPVTDGTIVAGLGGYRTEHYPRGKKRATTALNETSFTRLATSSDGRWLLAAYRDATLFDLRDGHREVFFEVEETEEPLGAMAMDDDATTLALGTFEGAVYVIDRERLGVMLYPPKGEAIVVQPPASEVVERGTSREETKSQTAKPDGQHDIHGWRRWHVGDRFLELPDHVEELAVLPNGDLVARARTKLLVMDQDGRRKATFAGHGAELIGLAVSPDGNEVTVWDRHGVVRRWRLS